jgi:mutator protein MutT
VEAKNAASVVVAIAVIRRGGQVLISRRRDGDAFGGCWEFPGGQVRSGETARRAVVREVREELGIGVRVLSPMEPIEHDYPGWRVRLVPFTCELVEGAPRAIGCSELRWVRPARLSRHRFPPANAPLIAALTSTRAPPTSRPARPPPARRGRRSS